MKRIGVAAALAVAVGLPAGAQDVQTVCAGVPAAFTGRCVAAVQTAHSAQPQLGILVAGGFAGMSPVAGGTPLVGPLRLNASARVGLVPFHLPRITEEANVPLPEQPAPLNDELTSMALALDADVALGIIPGFRVARGIRLGAVDLLGSVTYLPYDLISREVFHSASDQVATGAGVRLGLLAESRVTPAVAVTVSRHRLGTVQIGAACEGDQVPDAFSTTSPPSTFCREEGDVAQASVSVKNWSTRVSVSKRMGWVGLAAGGGYDRFSGDFDVEVLGNQGTPIVPTRVYHSPGGRVESERWSGFVSAAYTVLGGMVGVEAGWMSGGERVPGFSTQSDYDPGKGTLSVSLGLRLAM